MHIKWLELILVASVALGIAFWQLYDVTKAIKADKESHAPDDADDSGSKAKDQIAEVREQSDQ